MAARGRDIFDIFLLRIQLKSILINSGHLDQHFIQWAQPSISVNFPTRWPQSRIFQIFYFIDMYINIYVFEYAEHEYEG